MSTRDTVPPAPPEPAPLPADRCGWTADPRRAALLVLNVQNHFLNVLRETSVPVDALVAAIGGLVATARTAGVPVLYAVTAADADRTGRAAVFGHPSLPRDDSFAGFADIADGLGPRVGDTVLVARRFSAFAGTRLRQRLTELGRDQPVIAGVFTRTQVTLTAADAWMHDLEPFVVADAVADRTDAEHRAALDWIAATCGAVRTVHGVVDALG
ncbi:isochorismatase family protein [Streptomyces sp. NPDC014748]|uniref:isochorismatase family protein n=1 Tax=unclassified Streptomyces TaxID=2593676 RepID=UPI00146D7FC3|nr:isochorismatase family protein [Streptomyces sp. GMY02]NMO34949.1 isochorismatase family protein [Streptomyces sp. GMY02]